MYDGLRDTVCPTKATALVSSNWTLAIVMMASVIQSVPLKQQPVSFWPAAIMSCVKWVIFASSSLLLVLYSLHSLVSSTGQHSWPLFEDDAISSSDRPTASSNESEMTSSESKGREEEVERKSKEDDCLKTCRLQLTGRVSIVKNSDHDTTQLFYLFPWKLILETTRMKRYVGQVVFVPPILCGIAGLF
jgi:hypothetical protein